MAKVKVKLKLKDIVPVIEKNLQKASFDAFVLAVRAQIRKGISPVAQIGRFIRYSESYREAIKKQYGEAAKKEKQVSPVNMTLSGDMLKSLKTEKSDKGQRLFFEDPKAIFHDAQGAGKSKTIRRLLPTQNGETFTNVLLRKFRDICRAVVQRSKFK